MIWFPASRTWSPIRLPDVRRGALPLARREVLKIGGFAACAMVAGALVGCAESGRHPVEAVEPGPRAFFTDGTDFVD